MKKQRFTEEQIIWVLKEQEAGVKAADLCRKHGISQATFYSWLRRHGGVRGQASISRIPDPGGLCRNHRRSRMKLQWQVIV